MSDSSNSQLVPVIFVTGTDRAAVVDALAKEREDLLALLELVAGAEEFSGPDLQAVTRALDAAATPAMFGGNRLVILRDGVTEESLPSLTLYAKEPGAGAVLLLSHVRSGRSTKAYNALTKAVRASGQLVEVAGAPSRQGDLSSYIREASAAQGLRLSRDALAYLVSRLGADTGAINRVLEQLHAACPTAEVDLSSVTELVVGPAQAKVWDLTDAIDGGSIAGALRHLDALLREMHELQVEAVLINHVRKLVRAAEGRPRSSKDVETALGIKAFPAKKVFGRVQALPFSRLVSAHRLLVTANQDLRGRSGLEMRVILQVLVARLSVRIGGERNLRRAGISARS